jgi:hypothetical protein
MKPEEEKIANEPSKFFPFNATLCKNEDKITNQTRFPCSFLIEVDLNPADCYPD